MNINSMNKNEVIFFYYCILKIGLNKKKPNTSDR